MRIQISEDMRNDGLTLLELAVAMFLLAIGVVSVMAVLITGQKANRASQAKTMAVNAAEQQMEAIFAAPPSSVLTFNGQTFDVGDLRRPGGAQPGLITVSTAEPREITITVVWEGAGALSAGQVTLRALRSFAPR